MSLKSYLAGRNDLFWEKNNFLPILGINVKKYIKVKKKPIKDEGWLREDTS